MPTTYSQLLDHFVFSTKGRAPLIHADLQPRLLQYLGGACRAHGCTLLRAGGVEDHVHLLVRMSHDVAPSALMREIKSGSSRWLRAEVGVREFAWQEGYGAFSVSASQADAVKTYIDRQPEHHQRRGFREELLELLDRHGVEYDPRYVLD